MRYFRKRPTAARHQQAEPTTRRFDDGREICLASPAGRAEYARRKQQLWQGQAGVCALAGCAARMTLDDARLTVGEWQGSLRDDRLDRNKLVHKRCLAAWHAGSRATSQPEFSLLVSVSAVLLTLLAVACPMAAPAQAASAAAISGQVNTTSGTPAANAKVRVCLVTAVGTPCSTTGVTLYSDYNLTQPVANPISTNSFGNYSVFTAAGLYMLQITPQAGTTYTYYFSAGSTGTSSGVTSVALTLPTSVFSVSGSPITSAGTLAGSFLTQTANSFFAGPGSGAAAVPSFRGLAAADVTAAGTLTNSTTGNATTATVAAALSHTPIVCGAGLASVGIAANGDTFGCVPAATSPAGTLYSMQYNAGGGAFGGASFNGLVLNSTTGVPTAASYPNVVSLFGGGTCTGFLKSDGTCAATSTTAAGTQGSLQIAGSTAGTFANPLDANSNPLVYQLYKATSDPRTARWRECLSNAGTQVCNFLVEGDSFNVANSVNSSLAIPVGARYVDRLRTTLQLAYGSHGTGMNPILAGVPCSAADANNWVYSGGSVSCNGVIGPITVSGQGRILVMNSGETLTYTSLISWDTFHLYCAKTASSNQLSVSIDGSGSTSACGASTVNETSITAGSATAVRHDFSFVGLSPGHTVVITCATGPCLAFAGQGTAGTTGVDVHNVGAASGAAEIIGTNSVTQMAFDDLIPGTTTSGATYTACTTYCLQLAEIEYLTNEPGTGASTTTYATSLGNIVTHLRGYSDPPSILMYIPGEGAITGTGPYVPVMQAAANTYNTALANQRAQWGASAGTDLFGNTTTGGSAGPLHPSEKGNGDEFATVLSSATNGPIGGYCPACLQLNGGIYFQTVTNTNTGSANQGLVNMFFASPNLLSTAQSNLQVGVAPTLNNAAGVGFNYVSSGSSSNFAVIGLNAATNVLKVCSTGAIMVATGATGICNTTNNVTMTGFSVDTTGNVIDTADIQAATIHAGGSTSGKLVCTADGTNCPAATGYTLGGTLTSANVALGTGAGTSPGSVSVLGTDANFQVQFTTGTSPAASGTVFTVTFTATRSHACYAVVDQSGNILSYTGGVTQFIHPDNTSTGNISFRANAALPASSSLIFNVSCP